MCVYMWTLSYSSSRFHKRILPFLLHMWQHSVVLMYVFVYICRTCACMCDQLVGHRTPCNVCFPPSCLSITASVERRGASRSRVDSLQGCHRLFRVARHYHRWPGHTPSLLGRGQTASYLASLSLRSAFSCFMSTRVWFKIWNWVGHQFRMRNWFGWQCGSGTGSQSIPMFLTAT